MNKRTLKALIRRRAEAVGEGKLREHHGQVGGKNGHDLSLAAWTGRVGSLLLFSGKAGIAPERAAPTWPSPHLPARRETCMLPPWQLPPQRNRKDTNSR